MKPNILFLLVDSLRSDRCYGKNKTANPPNVDYLIKNGCYFTNSVGTSDYTKACMQGILTAKNPVGCGDLLSEYYSKIFSDKSNLLNVLKDNNYHLYGIMEDALCLVGLNRQMENKDDAGFKDTLNLHNGLREKIFSKFNELRKSEPWFYYVHFMDLHKPCPVPEDFVNLSLSERYDFNIETIDSCIGELLEKIDLKNTLVVFTADHGEYLSPFDNYTGKQDSSNRFNKTTKSILKSLIPKSYGASIHVKKKNIQRKIRESKIKLPHEKRALKTRPSPDRMLFDDVVKTPLIISGCDITESSIIDQQVRSIDIFPTILDLLNLNFSQKITGMSLKPLLEGKSLVKNIAYMESTVLRKYFEKPKPVVGIRTDEFKYFRSLNDSTKTVHLYDLQNNPFEDDNIAKKNPDKIQKFEKILAELRSDVNIDKTSEKISLEEEKELEEELKKLGYI